MSTTFNVTVVPPFVGRVPFNGEQAAQCPADDGHIGVLRVVRVAIRLNWSPEYRSLALERWIAVDVLCWERSLLCISADAQGGSLARQRAVWQTRRRGLGRGDAKRVTGKQKQTDAVASC